MPKTDGKPGGPPPRREYPNEGSGYELLEQIGQGTSATVYRALCHATSEEVAIKIVDLEWFQASLEDIWREIQVMSQSAHPNVVPYSISFVQGADLWVVMPLLTGGSVQHFIQSLSQHGMDEELTRYILYESLKAIAYFHANGQMHRDVKAANILLNKKGNVMLSDYGVMGWMVEGGMKRKNRQTFVGTPCWMAPEVMEQAHGYDYKADIWSFGITAMELAQGRAPYVTYPPMKVLLLTLTNPPPDLEPTAEERYSQGFKEMVKLCLQKDPSNRPTAEQLLNHKYFKNVTMPTNLPDLIAGLPALGSTADNQARLYRQLQKEKQGVGRSGIYERLERNCGWDFTGDVDENIDEFDSILKASMGPAKPHAVDKTNIDLNGFPAIASAHAPIRASSAQDISSASLRTPPSNMDGRVHPQTAPTTVQIPEGDLEPVDSKSQPQLPSTAAVSLPSAVEKPTKVETAEVKVEPVAKASEKKQALAKDGGSESGDSASASSLAENSPVSEKQPSAQIASPQGSSQPSSASHTESVDGESNTAHQKRGRFVVVSDLASNEAPANTDMLPPASAAPAVAEGPPVRNAPGSSAPKEASRPKQAPAKTKKESLQTSQSEPQFREPDPIPIKKPVTRFTVTERASAPVSMIPLRNGPPPPDARRSPAHPSVPQRTASQQNDLSGQERIRAFIDETSHTDLLSGLNEKFNWINLQHDAVKNEISKLLAEKLTNSNERAADKSIIAARDSDLQAASVELNALKSEKLTLTTERDSLVTEVAALKAERAKLRHELDSLREKSPQRTTLQ